MEGAKICCTFGKREGKKDGKGKSSSFGKAGRISSTSAFIASLNPICIICFQHFSHRRARETARAFLPESNGSQWQYDEVPSLWIKKTLGCEVPTSEMLTWFILGPSSFRRNIWLAAEWKMPLLSSVGLRLEPSQRSET